MKTLLLFFASGYSWFIGLGLVALFCVGIMLKASPVLAAVGRVLAMVGVLFMLLSSVPIPWWEWVLFLAALGIVFFAQWERDWGGYWRWGGVVACLVVTGTLFITEWAAQQAPRKRIKAIDQIIVLGDSLSSEPDGQAARWPTVVEKQSGIPVKNLSEPDMTVARALRILREPSETSGQTLLIVQVGAQDFAGDTGSERFAFQLSELVDIAQHRGHKVVVLMPPLPPFSNHYAAAFRRSTDAEHVTLLPRWCFSNVLGHPGATLDGLTLTRVGHELFGQMILEKVLGMTSGNNRTAQTINPQNHVQARPATAQGG